VPTKIRLKPLGNRIAVKREEAEGKSKGGILLPDTAKEKPKRGVVVAVGLGKRTDDGVWVAPEIMIGDTVVFTAYAGSEVKVDEDDYLVLAVEDVLAVVAAD
jgi:chaperonin GroES